jgi:hypothetical protein
MLSDQKVVDSYEKANKYFDDYISKYDPEYLAELENDLLLRKGENEDWTYFMDPEDRHTPEIHVKKIKIE